MSKMIKSNKTNHDSYNDNMIHLDLYSVGCILHCEINSSSKKCLCIVVAFTVVLHFEGELIQNIRHVHPTVRNV